MRIHEHLSEGFIDKMYRKIFYGMKENKCNHINKDSQRETERLMGKYKNTLHRGRGGAWK